MIWKTLFVALFAVGVLAEYQLSDAHRNQIKNALRESCKANGNEDKVESVEAAGKNFVECIKSLFDPETLHKEIEAAKPNGELDEVFKKYCAKSPQLKTCIHSLTSSITPCLDANMREQIDHVHNSTDQLIDFVCYKDGDRIALFIAEGGPECFQEKALAIRECANKMKEGITSFDDAKSLSLESRCAKFDQLSACVVKALEECSTPTPGNMAESLFKYVKNGSQCKK